MSDQIEREQQIEEESLTKNSLQIQKAAWIREELEKRRAQEDQLLQQILREQFGDVIFRMDKQQVLKSRWVFGGLLAVSLFDQLMLD